MAQPAVEGLDSEDPDRDQTPGQADDHAEIDDAAPGLRQVVGADDEADHHQPDRDHDDLPLTLDVEVNRLDRAVEHVSDRLRDRVLDVRPDFRTTWRLEQRRRVGEPFR